MKPKHPETLSTLVKMYVGSSQTQNQSFYHGNTINVCGEQSNTKCMWGAVQHKMYVGSSPTQNQSFYDGNTINGQFVHYGRTFQRIFYTLSRRAIKYNWNTWILKWA